MLLKIHILSLFGILRVFRTPVLSAAQGGSWTIPVRLVVQLSRMRLPKTVCVYVSSVRFEGGPKFTSNGFSGKVIISKRSKLLSTVRASERFHPVFSR